MYVSYRGGCLIYSLLTLRSGNKSRCIEKSRREYQIYKNNKLLAEYVYHFSMTNLNNTDCFKK